MSIVLQSSGGGSVTINEPSTASNFSANLPAATGDVMVSGNMPAFSASMSAGQTVSNSTATKLVFNTEVYDTNNCYDPTTNYRFTPTVAGYYQVSAGVLCPSSAIGVGTIYIYKNGARALTCQAQSSTSQAIITISGLMYCNGTTDYIEGWCLQTTGGSATMGSSDATLSYFQATMVRSA
jgi:hypothetical protein